MKKSITNQTNSFFHQLGLDIRFTVDLDFLEEQYKNQYILLERCCIQDQIHQLAQLNQAYNTIKEPFKRAVYLLKLLNIQFNELGCISHDFLEEIYEINEKIDNVSEKKLLQNLLKSNTDKKQNIVLKMQDAFDKAEHISEFVRLTQELSYIQNIIQKIKAKLTSI